MLTSLVTVLEFAIWLSQVDGRSPCVNGDIAIQWELSNFDPSQNQNSLTDYDKTLHNY